MHVISKKTYRQKLTWGPEADKAFQTVKDTLANSTMLAFPTPGAEISLLVDASNFAVGAVLQQKVERHRFPPGFFSRALSPTQQNYLTFDRELLGIFLAIKDFRYFVEGRPLIIWIDHASLTHAIPSALTESTGRRLRQLQFISEFTSDIRHIKGEENVEADYLSRPSTVNAIFQGLQSIDRQRIAQEQRTDPSDIRNLQEDDNTSLKLVKHNLSDSGLTLLIDMSREAARAVVPSALHKHVFGAVHSISHPGIRASRKLIG